MQGAIQSAPFWFDLRSYWAIIDIKIKTRCLRVMQFFRCDMRSEFRTRFLRNEQFLRSDKRIGKRIESNGVFTNAKTGCCASFMRKSFVQHRRTQTFRVWWATLTRRWSTEWLPLEGRQTSSSRNFWSIREKECWFLKEEPRNNKKKYILPGYKHKD